MATAKAVQERIAHGVSANSPLPPSVETAYYRKCIELKRRINEIEENNDTLRVKKQRIERAVLKMRIERAMLLEQIASRMKENPDDSDESNSPPPTPQDRPLRSKRAHRKGTPPPGGPSGGVPPSSPLPPSTAGPTILDETPNPLRVREFQPAASTENTPAPNGVQLPPLSSALPSTIAPQSGPSGFSALNNPAPEENGDTEMGGTDSQSYQGNKQPRQLPSWVEELRAKELAAEAKKEAKAEKEMHERLKKYPRGWAPGKLRG